MKLRIPFGNYIDSQIKAPTAPYAHSLGMGNGMNVKRVGKQEALVPTHSNITNKLLLLPCHCNLKLEISSGNCMDVHIWMSMV